MSTCPRSDEHDYQYQDNGYLAGYLVCTRYGRVSRCPEDGEHNYQFQDDGWPACTKCGDRELRHMDHGVRDLLIRSRREQGLPFQIQDEAVLARVAALVNNSLNNGDRREIAAKLAAAVDEVRSKAARSKRPVESDPMVDPKARGS